MKLVRVIVADDSVVYRTQIKAALSRLSWVEVVGTAANGKIAIDLLEQTKADLLTLDLEMPTMDGIQTLKELSLKNISPKVLVFSSASKRGAEITFEALRLGAHDFIAKPGPSAPGAVASFENRTDPSTLILEMLEPKIKGLFPDVEFNALASQVKTEAKSGGYQKLDWELFRPRILVIASSTGGPTVLEKIFQDLSAPVDCPILITQHMPPVFTATLAERIQKISGIPAREGIHGEVLEKNRIYIAPGNYHMSLTGSKENATIVLDQGPLVNSVRPAADPMFESAARIFGSQCLGIVLTGMGADGRDGAVKVKEANGMIIIQERESCIVFGMPGAVMDAQAYDRMQTPDGIISSIQEKVAKSVRLKNVASGGA